MAERKLYVRRFAKSFTDAELTAMEKMNGKVPLDSNLSPDEKYALHARLIKKSPLTPICAKLSMSEYKVKKFIHKAIAKLK